ncbi:MAG: nucleoside 2-deoxyribosyltransferase [Nocardiopsaceae bacterium]|nr:nucleoside 2-deoxyribosyltransferase [Nocardiopsaceae bacterium]
MFYVAHRLFAAHDRVLGAHIAARLASETGTGSVFLPFCDTGEDTLASDCKGRLLFDLDCARLRRITGMIAVLHGPSLDDGVCMEIGFAAARGIPVILVSTDFQTYALADCGPQCTFPDPLLEHLATSVIRAHRLGPFRGHAHGGRFRAFLEQNLATVQAAADQAVAELLTTAGVHAPERHSAMILPHLAYIEPSPYFPDPMWEAVHAELHARGWQVHTARRFQDRADPVAAAGEDWTAVTAASLAIIDVRGPETPPGAALITGARAVAGKRVLAAWSGSWHTLADGREPNWRNLMIQYALTARFTSIRDLVRALESLP